MTTREFYFTVEPDWVGELERFKDLMAKAGLSKTDFPIAIGVSSSDISNLKLNRRRDTYHSKIAANIIAALGGQKPLSNAGLRTVCNAWAAQNGIRAWLARDLNRQLVEESKRLLAQTLNPLVPPPEAPPVGHKIAEKPKGVAATAGETPRSAQTGKTTGNHVTSVRELCAAKAEWRNTNLGPGEGQWLQLDLRFKESYTRDRARDLELPVHLHRVHVDIDLDGGSARSRDEFNQATVSGDLAIKIFKSIAWEPDRPAYEVDNPEKTVQLSGIYEWFDLCEAIETVGPKAFLEVSASIGGIRIPIPAAISNELDPDKKSVFDVPEERLLQAWLRHRCVPPSELSGAGMWRLARIELVPNNDRLQEHPDGQ